MSVAIALILALLYPPRPHQIESIEDYQDCLDDRDLTSEDNDGQCEEP